MFTSAAIALIVIIGCIHWHNEQIFGLSAAALCLYDKADCSIAAATWILCLFTWLAFIAAYAAYFNEIVPRLGERACHKESNHHDSINVYITEENLFINHQPTEYNTTLYLHGASDFTNLGRSPLIDLQVEIAYTYKHKKIEKVCLGNLPKEGRIHVAMHMLAHDVIRPNSLPSWTGKALHADGSFDFKVSEPIDIQRTQTSLPLHVSAAPPA